MRGSRSQISSRTWPVGSCALRRAGGGGEVTFCKTTRDLLHEQIRVEPCGDRVVAEVGQAVDVAKGLGALHLQFHLPAGPVDAEYQLGGDSRRLGGGEDDHVLSGPQRAVGHFLAIGAFLSARSFLRGGSLLVRQPEDAQTSLDD